MEIPAPRHRWTVRDVIDALVVVAATTAVIATPLMLWVVWPPAAAGFAGLVVALVGAACADVRRAGGERPDAARETGPERLESSQHPVSLAVGEQPKSSLPDQPPAAFVAVVHSAQVDAATRPAIAYAARSGREPRPAGTGTERPRRFIA